jgi:CCR4-NOT transcription complex subunit 7/8
MNKKNVRKEEGIIKEVYYENFEAEMKKISSMIDTYNYIALDTEFPGFVYSGQGLTQKEIYYDSIKSNVDKLKLIQVGLTLCDEEGNYPKDISTWQFNFNFDLK